MAYRIIEFDESYPGTCVVRGQGRVRSYATLAR